MSEPKRHHFLKIVLVVFVAIALVFLIQSIRDQNSQQTAVEATKPAFSIEFSKNLPIVSLMLYNR